MTNTPAPKTTLNPGKLAVVGILLVAVGLAGFAWWWNWQRTQRCREFFGGEGAHLIRTATKVEGLRLNDAPSGWAVREELRFSQHLATIKEKFDVSQARGLIHARTALLDDSSYRWDDQTTHDCEAVIRHAVRFHGPGQQVTLVFDYGCSRMWIVETQREVMLAPKIAAGWQSFLTRELGPAPPTDPAWLSPPR